MYIRRRITARSLFIVVATILKVYLPGPTLLYVMKPLEPTKNT